MFSVRKAEGSPALRSLLNWLNQQLGPWNLRAWLVQGSGRQRMSLKAILSRIY
jgi:hypothetical protein